MMKYTQKSGERINPSPLFDFFLGIDRGLLLGHYIIEAVEGLHSLYLGGGNSVGVDVCRGRGLGVAELPGPHEQGSPTGYHQGT